MMHVSPRSAARGAAWLVRRRVQLAGALLLAAFGPLLVRAILTPQSFWYVATFHAFLANIAAVLFAFWLRLSFEPYPGIRSSYVILPTASVAHGSVLVFFFFSRLPYDRLGFLLGFLFHIAFFYLIYFLIQRRLQMRIAVVPIGEVARLQVIDSVHWKMLEDADVALLADCDALVADFSAELTAEWERFLADAALAGTIVYQVKPLIESLTGRVEIDHLSENSFGSLVPARGYFHFKSVLDWFIALASLPIVLPVLAAVAAAIVLDDNGKIFFRQSRVGHRGRAFKVYKFRTMRVAAETNDALAAAMTGTLDPRITRVGGFLRRARLDELPQILNILRGEMSWIGPRPEALVLSSWYVGELPFYRYRHVVKPGISGWAQVNQGHVAEVHDVLRKLHYDFYYIKYFSPWLDLLIVFKTLKTMASGFGAK